MTQPDSRQVKKRQSLKNLGTAALASVEVVLDKVNIEVDSPLKLSASATPDAILNFTSSQISAADDGKKVVSAVKKQIFSTLSSPWINFQTQAISNAADFDITWPTPNIVGRFRYAGFTLIGSGKIKVLFTSEAVSEGALSNPGALFVSGGLPLGYIALECTDTLGYFKTAGSATNIVENTKIYRLAAGGGASSTSAGSTGGGELVDLLYQAAIRDSFANIPDGTTTIDINAGFTDSSLHDVANELFRINYDATLTVTGTGTSMTLSVAPNFTVKIGDMLIVGTEARKITAIPTQTTPTIESAFAVDPSASACNVSQAIHTTDLNAFTAGGLGLAASSQFAGSIDEILVGYEDTSTAGDIIPNFGTAPVISYSASADATTWTTIQSRVTSLSIPESFVTMPVTGTSLNMRFFSNATSGSGAVNLLGYKVFFHKQLANVVGAAYLTAFARPTASIAQNCAIGLVSGKTRFTFTFPYTVGLNLGEASGSVLEVYVNGQLVPRRAAGITDDAQAYFIEIDGSTIEMDTDYSAAGVDFQFKVQRVNIIDSNTINTTKIALHEDLLDQNLDAQVVPTFLSAVNGSPSLVQFRSDITGRASIPDLSSMLSVQMGPQRMMTQEIYQLQTEFGPAGQPVFGVVNDKFNQARFVGSWGSVNGVQGAGISTVTLGDYLEVIFYGTGLNLLSLCNNAATPPDIRVSIDGGSEGSNLFTPSTASSVISSRNYSTNQIVSIASNLALGLHTLKIRLTNTVAGLDWRVSGFEVLTETTSLRVAPGTVMKGKYKNSLNALQTVAYDSNFESGALGAKGGCVLVYLKNDGTIGKAVTPTDATALYYPNASHTNEEVIRYHHPNEFAAGRSDDWAATPTTGMSRTYTLDDGTTTLTGFNMRGLGLLMVDGTSNWTLTFIGTGIDILEGSGSATGLANFFIDGVLQASAVPSTVSGRIITVASGLPYGTHTLKVTFSNANNFSVNGIYIYTPKKPALPVGSVELVQYYKNADYAAASSGANTFVGVGVTRKTNIREAVYVSTWTGPSIDVVSFETGWNIATTTIGAYVEYTFWGTGIVFTGLAQAGAAQGSFFSIDGNVNTSAFTTSLVQTSTGLTFNSTTGNLLGTPAAQSKYRISISGLPLGKHTLRVSCNTVVTGLYIDGFDIISPIHAPTINGPYVVQNTLALGNNGFLDLRKFNNRDIVLSNQSKTGQANGVSSSGTTTSTTPVPLYDLSVTQVSKTGKIRVSYTSGVRSSVTNGTVFHSIYIDGVPAGRFDQNVDIPTAGDTNLLTNSVIVNVSPGFHKIDIYWSTPSGTATAIGVRRNLTVEDI